MPTPFVPQPGISHRGSLAADLKPDQTLYRRIGGQPSVDRIIDGLYDRIEADTDIRPMFTRTLTQEREKQKAFFKEWLGGDPDYTYHHAYGGMKSRHRHIHITHAAAERWLGHMTASLQASIEDDALVDEFLQTLRPLAYGLVNESQPVQHPKHLRCHREKCWHQPKELAAKNRLEELRQIIKTDAYLLDDRNQAAEILAAAVARGHMDIVSYLHGQGIDINIPVPTRVDLLMTPLCLARWKKQHEMEAFLTSKGAIYDIFSASFLGDLNSVSCLLADKPDLVNAHDPACDLLPVTPLHHAVYGGHLPITTYLFAQGAEVGPNSTAMIQSAADSGRIDLVRILLEHNADATRIGPGKWVMEPELAELLLAHGADVNYPPGQWIWQACTGNNSQRDEPAYIQGLLDCGADIHTALRGARALHYVAKAGFVKALEVLLNHNAPVNAVNEKGETPLFYAFKAGKRADVVTIIKRLLEKGADMDHKDQKGNTPREIARRLRRPDAEQITELFS